MPDQNFNLPPKKEDLALQPTPLRSLTNTPKLTTKRSHHLPPVLLQINNWKEGASLACMIDRQGASSISSTSGTRQKQQLQVSQTYSLQIRRTDNFKIWATIRKKKNNTYPRLGCEAKLHDSPSRTPISTSLKGLTPPSPMSPLQTTLVKKQLRTREYVHVRKNRKLFIFRSQKVSHTRH